GYFGPAFASLVLLDDLLEVGGDWGKGLADEVHLAAGVLAEDDVELGVVVGLIGVDVAELGTPGFFAFDGGSCGGFGDGEEVAEVDGGVPAGVVLAVLVGHGP